MATHKQTSLLVAGIPLKRGMPDHIESDTDLAFCEFDKQSGKLQTITTPRTSILKRTHEQMHGRFTDPARFEDDYGLVPDTVAQVSEDCRIHLRHWPWRHSSTPNFVRANVLQDLKIEIDGCNARKSDKTKPPNPWGDFATRLRAAAVRSGMSRNTYEETWNVGFETDAQREFARTVLHLLETDEAATAAELLQKAFFPDWKPPEAPKRKRRPKGSPKRKGKRRRSRRDTRPGLGGREYKMDVIELPHPIAIQSAEVGYRLTTSGPRMFRPALRRPILTGRMFLRRSPVEPGGTILIDASGSMGEFSEIEKWCEASPFATVAYYAGEDSGEHGWLYVYARNGFRAATCVEPPNRGNLVDGKALDWLMSQDGPRYLITDRGFCGAADSEAQIMRLATLEASGDITVKEYKTS